MRGERRGVFAATSVREWRSHGRGAGPYRSPGVVQLRPNTRQNGVAGLTRDQHETTRFKTPLNLQNLHPRFKSGRRLHPSLSGQAKDVHHSSREFRRAKVGHNPARELRMAGQFHSEIRDLFLRLCFRPIASVPKLFPNPRFSRSNLLSLMPNRRAPQPFGRNYLVRTAVRSL